MSLQSDDKRRSKHQIDKLRKVNGHKTPLDALEWSKENLPFWFNTVCRNPKFK